MPLGMNAANEVRRRDHLNKILKRTFCEAPVSLLALSTDVAEWRLHIRALGLFLFHKLTKAQLQLRPKNNRHGKCPGEWCY